VELNAWIVGAFGSEGAIADSARNYAGRTPARRIFPSPDEVVTGSKASRASCSCWFDLRQSSDRKESFHGELDCLKIVVSIRQDVPTTLLVREVREDVLGEACAAFSCLNMLRVSCLILSRVSLTIA
jgi:hypothetical protein